MAQQLCECNILGVAGDSNASLAIVAPYTAIGSFTPGDNDAASFWVKGSVNGCYAVVQNIIMASDTTYLGGAWVPFTLTDSWTRQVALDTSLPANTSRATTRIMVNGIDTGNTVDITIDAVQLEKGTFATSYIPTTTTVITRNADIVTVPTTNWHSDTGTIIATAGWGYSAGRYLSWVGGSIAISLYRPSSNQIQGVIGGSPTYMANKTGTYISTAAMTWVNGGSLFAYMDGSPGTATTNVATTSLPATANVGGYVGYDYIDGPMQRLTVYSSALSSSDVNTVTNSIKDGP